MAGWKDNSLTKSFEISQGRCASFHPTEPVLACGLLDGRVILLKEPNQSSLFCNWIKSEIPKVDGGYKVSIAWNVRMRTITQCVI